VVMAWICVFLSLFFSLEKHLPRKGFRCEALSETDLACELRDSIALFTSLLPGSHVEPPRSVTVEPPRSVTVEPLRSVTVEPLRSIPGTPSQCHRGTPSQCHRGTPSQRPWAAVAVRLCFSLLVGAERGDKSLV